MTELITQLLKLINTLLQSTFALQIQMADLLARVSQLEAQMPTFQENLDTLRTKLAEEAALRKKASDDAAAAVAAANDAAATATGAKAIAEAAKAQDAAQDDATAAAAALGQTAIEHVDALLSRLIEAGVLPPPTP